MDTRKVTVTVEWKSATDMWSTTYHRTADELPQLATDLIESHGGTWASFMVTVD